VFVRLFDGSELAELQETQTQASQQQQQPNQVEKVTLKSDFFLLHISFGFFHRLWTVETSLVSEAEQSSSSLNKH